MPRGDRTGPMGRGAMTGRSLGFCSGADAAGYNAGGGIGLGRRFLRGIGTGYGRGAAGGWGRGLRRNLAGYRATDISPRELLQKEKQALENRLELINKELDSL